MNREKGIAIMQHNLLHIRKSLNLSGKEFGEMIGVTRQTINNIEGGRNKLTTTMYLAILYVLNTNIFPNLDDERRKYVEDLLKFKVIKTEYAKSLTLEEDES